MAAFLRHQESGRVQSCHQGIFWWLLRFFDIQHRFRLRKLFVERKRIKTSFDDGCTNPPFVRKRSGGEQLRLLLKEADDPMEDKKSFRWSSLKSLMMLKKMSKKLSRKKKKIPPASQLQQHTVSATHSMERNDFALFEVLTTGGDASLPRVESTDSFPGGGCRTRKKSEACDSFNAANCGGPNQIKKLGDQFLENQAVLMEELAKANVQMKDADKKKQGQRHVVVYKESDFTDVLELLSAELFCKMLRDPSFECADNAGDQGSSGLSSFMKCGSFPGSTGGKSCGFYRFKPVGDGVRRNSFGLERTPSSVPRHKDFRQRIKDVIKDSKEEGARLSLDGVLHKIPIGHNVNEDITASDRSLRGRKYGFPHKDNKPGYQSFQRSRSVTSDPFDRYAHLFESSSFRDSQRLAAGSKPSTFREGAMPDENPTRRWGRTVSNPEFVRSLDRSGVEDPLAIYEHSAKESSDRPDHIPGQNLDSYRQEQLPSIEETTSYTEDVDPRKSEDVHRSHPKENSTDYSNEAIGCSDPATLIVNKEEFEVPNDLETEEGSCVSSPEGHEHKAAKLSPVSVLDCSHRELDFVTDLMIDYSGDDDEFQSSRTLEAGGDVEGSPELLRLAGDRQLLSDLINEVLLETYARSSSFRHGFRWRIRPTTPEGCRALERAWASVGHLVSQSRLDPAFEHVAALDKSKQDEWLDIRQDMDFLGLELEVWMLDDLLCDAFSR